MRRNFRSPWDIKLMVMTGIMLALLCGILISGRDAIPTVMILSIILGTAALGVYGYSIQKHELHILRLGWDKTITFDDIIRVEVKTYVMMGSIRTFGIGGLFGYIGFFSNGILGSHRAFATKRQNTVLIETDDQHKFVVAPDDPAEFVAALQNQINRDESREGRLQTG